MYKNGIPAEYLARQRAIKNFEHGRDFRNPVKMIYERPRETLQHRGSEPRDDLGQRFEITRNANQGFTSR